MRSDLSEPLLVEQNEDSVLSEPTTGALDPLTRKEIIITTCNFLLRFFLQFLMMAIGGSQELIFKHYSVGPAIFNLILATRFSSMLIVPFIAPAYTRLFGGDILLTGVFAACMLLLFAILNFVAAVFVNVALLFPIQVLFGINYDLVLSIARTTLQRNVVKTKLGKLGGLARVGSLLGSALAMYSPIVFGSLMGVDISFLVITCIIIINMAIPWFLLAAPNSPPSHGDAAATIVSKDETSSVTSDEDPVTAKSLPRSFWNFVIIGAVGNGMVFMPVRENIVGVFTVHYKLNAVTSAWLASVHLIVGLVTVLVVSPIFDRVGGRSFALRHSLLAMSITSALLLCASRDFPVLFLALVNAGLGVAIGCYLAAYESYVPFIVTKRELFVANTYLTSISRGVSCFGALSFYLSLHFANSYVPAILFVGAIGGAASVLVTLPPEKAQLE